MDRRIRSAILVLTGIISMSFMGCTSQDETNKDDGKGSQVTAGGEVSEKSDDKKITLEVWHCATNRDDPSHVAILDAIEDFRQEHPNIEVIESGQTTDNQKTRVRTAAAANELPDVFFTWGNTWSQDIAESGKLLDLTPYLTEEVTSQLKEGALNSLTYDDISYGLPDNGWYQTIYLNTELFEQNNIPVPVTYDEFMSAVDAFVAKGINPIIMGAKQGNQMTQVYDSIMIRLMGAKKVKEAYKDWKAMDEELAVKGAQMLYDMGKRGAFNDASYTLNNPDAAATFITGQYPIAILNAGFIGQIEGADSKIATKTIAVPTFFKLGNGAKYDDDEQGDFVGMWTASAKTKDPDMAYELLAFLSKAASKAYYEQGSQQMGYKATEWDNSKQSQLYKDFADMTTQFKELTAAGGEIRKADIVPNISDLCVALSRGKVAPEDFVAQIKSLYE